jgi:ribose transport system substrate-binding protein
MRKLLSAMICLGLGLGVLSCAKSKDKKLTIAVIPKGTTHVFWKSVEAGAKKAGAELGVNIVWKGPLKESDRADQIKLVEQFIAEGVDGIVLAPLDSEALLRPVQSAMQKKIPVVIFDSALKGEAGKDFVSFVATNNRKGGQMAGEQLAKLLGDKGKVVLLRYSVGSASTEEREAGFLDILKQKPNITMLVDNRYGGATVGEAKTEAMKLVDQLRQADGVFCPNESSTLGMLGALQDNNLAGKTTFVGFDATPPLVEALKKGEIKALIAQDPTRMGYEGVKTVVAQIHGEKVEPMVDTGVRLITPEGLNSPEIKKFLGLE